jgi:hypothetical protein
MMNTTIPTSSVGTDDTAPALYANGAFRHLPDASSDDLAMMSLIGVSETLRAVQMSVWSAAFALKGARQERAKELIKLLSAAHEHCERLRVVVEGDPRANNPDRTGV